MKKPIAAEFLDARNLPSSAHYRNIRYSLCEIVQNWISRNGAAAEV